MRPSTLPSIAKLAASRPHGDRVRYLSGCHCMLCRAANSRYETTRAAARKAGDWNGLVPAGPARRHIEWLSLRGVGRDSVAAAADVGVTDITLIKTGKRTQIRARTEKSILAVTTGARAGGSIVDGRATWRKIRILLSEGFTKKALAHRLGCKSPALQIRRRVLARTAMKVDKLYCQAMR